MILSSGRKSKKGITTIKETGEMLTSRAGLSIVSHYLDNQSWLIEKLVSCGDFKGRKDKCDTWDTERRLVVTQLRSVGDQMIIPGMGRMSLSYTNLGIDSEPMRSFEDAGVDYLAKTENIIMLAHNRGEDELAHRHIKDFNRGTTLVNGGLAESRRSGLIKSSSLLPGNSENNRFSLFSENLSPEKLFFNRKTSFMMVSAHFLRF